MLGIRKNTEIPQLLGSFLSGNFCFTVCAFFFGDGKSGWDAAALGLARAEGAELGGKSGCGAAGRVSGTVAEGRWFRDYPFETFFLSASCANIKNANRSF